MPEIDTSTSTGRLLLALVQGLVEVIEVQPAVGSRMVIVIGPGPNSSDYDPPEPELGGEA